MTYDPAFMNTASCRSAITFIDGDKGILEYRGYPIEQLAEQSTYLEVAYLLVHGELPTQPQLDEWTHEITIHTFVHENIKELHAGLPLRRPPDGDAARRRSARSRPSTRTPRTSTTRTSRDIQTIRLIAKMPTLAAFAYRHIHGPAVRLPRQRPVLRRATSSSMLYKMTELKYEPDPRLERALDILFILHADHEQNCSTSAVRASAPRRSTRTRRSPPASPRSTARCTAAPTRRCCGCCARIEHEREHPRLHRGREGRQRAADGLRPPRLQELRPARDDHQEGRATTSSR